MLIGAKRRYDSNKPTSVVRIVELVTIEIAIANRRQRILKKVPIVTIAYQVHPDDQNSTMSQFARHFA
jgi:hypothetical protein